MVINFNIVALQTRARAEIALARQATSDAESATSPQRRSPAVRDVYRATFDKLNTEAQI